MWVIILVPMSLLFLGTLWLVLKQGSFPAKFRFVGKKYASTMTKRGLKGFEVAKDLLEAEGLADVRVLGGTTLNCYQGGPKVISLTRSVWESSSKNALFLAAVLVAFAVQHKVFKPHPLLRKAEMAFVELSYLGFSVVTLRKRFIPVLVLGAIAGFTPFLLLLSFAIVIVPLAILWTNLEPLVRGVRSWLLARKLLIKHGFGPDMEGFWEFSSNRIMSRILSTEEPERPLLDVNHFLKKEMMETFLFQVTKAFGGKSLSNRR